MGQQKDKFLKTNRRLVIQGYALLGFCGFIFGFEVWLHLWALLLCPVVFTYLVIYGLKSLEQTRKEIIDSPYL